MQNSNHGVWMILEKHGQRMAWVKLVNLVKIQWKLTTKRNTFIAAQKIKMHARVMSMCYFEAHVHGRWVCIPKKGSSADCFYKNKTSLKKVLLLYNPWNWQRVCLLATKPRLNRDVPWGTLVMSVYVFLCGIPRTIALGAQSGREGYHPKQRLLKLFLPNVAYTQEGTKKCTFGLGKNLNGGFKHMWNPGAKLHRCTDLSCKQRLPHSTLEIAPCIQWGDVGAKLFP